MNFWPDILELYQMDGSKRRIQQRRCLSHVTNAQLCERDRSPFKEATLSAHHLFLGKRLNNGQWPLRITGGALDVDVSVCASLAALQKYEEWCLLPIRGIKRQGQTIGQRQRQRETLGQWHGGAESGAQNV